MISGRHSIYIMGYLTFLSREHAATISFLFEEEKFIPKKSDSLPVAITGMFTNKIVNILLFVQVAK